MGVPWAFKVLRTLVPAAFVAVSDAAVHAETLCIDGNSIIHGIMLSKACDVTVAQVADGLLSAIHSKLSLVTRCLVVCFDGVAPAAKEQLQSQRRQGSTFSSAAVSLRFAVRVVGVVCVCEACLLPLSRRGRASTIGWS